MEVSEPSANYLVRSAKQRTDIGVLPLDWKLCRLGEITKLMTNGFVGTATKHYAPEEAGAIYIQGFNVEENAFNLSGVKYVTEAFHRAHQKSCLREGDLLTVQTGDVGLTTVVPPSLVGANCHALIISRLDRSVADPRYVSQYLNCAQGRARLKLIETGTTMKHLNVGDMLGFLVPQPPIAEQREIAQSLTDADAQIYSLEQLLTKKRQIKQGAMQELLTGKRRLPGFAGDWADYSLLQLAEIRSGGTPSTRQAEFWDGTIPWCTPTDITALVGAKYISETERSISEKGQKASSAEVLPVGTVVMTSRATIGECAIAAVPLTTNQGFKNFVPRGTTCGEFLYYLLDSQKSAFLALCSGSTFLEIGKRQLADFVVRCPSELEEQSAIADALCSIDNQIVALESRLTKARALKQAMAQALLTGKIRLI